MKKRLLKIVAMFGVIAVMFGSAVACGPKDTEAPNSTTDIQIGYWNAGLGLEWLERIAAKFEDKNPEYNVEITESAVLTEVNQNLLKKEFDTIDIYMTYFMDTLYEPYYENLESLLDMKCGNETKTIREKFNPYILDQMKREDGKIYTLSYGGGYSSICYNKDVIDGVKYTVPRTTDELDELAGALEREGKKPFIHFNPEGYLQYLATAWQAQYDGLDYYTNTFLPLKDPVTGTSPSKEVMRKKDGRWQAIEAMGSIFTEARVANNSNTQNHTTAQTRFLQGDAVMMVNGMWMLNEMGENGQANNMGIMKTPIISTIVDKCGSVDNESELRSLIDYVDAVTDGTIDAPTGETVSGTGFEVSKADFDRIYEARNIMYSNAVEHSFMIPTYSVAKEGAYKFAQFFFSDEALQIYFDATHFGYSAYFDDESIEIDMTGWSDFEKQLYDYYVKAIPVSYGTFGKSVIFETGGSNTFAKVQVINQLTAKGAARKSAAEIWSQIETTIDSGWNGWLANAGVKA